VLLRSGKATHHREDAMDDDKTMIRGADEGGVELPPEGKQEAAKEKVAGLVSGAEYKEGRVKVVPWKIVRERVLKLIEELAAKSCPEHIKEIHTLREDLEEARKQNEKLAAEVERLSGAQDELARLKAEIDRLNRELEGLRAAAAADLQNLTVKHQYEYQQLEAAHKEALDKVRAEAEGAARDRIVELERLLTVEQGRNADLEAKLAAAMADIQRLQTELEALKKQLSGEDARSKAELLKLIAELEARIMELELALDYFDLEDEPDAAALGARAEAAGKVGGYLGNAAQQAALDAAGAQKKFDALRAVMNEGKGSVAVVVDLVKQAKAAESAKSRVEVVEKCQ